MLMTMTLIADDDFDRRILLCRLAVAMRLVIGFRKA
jgi:hypothetical protein